MTQPARYDMGTAYYGDPMMVESDDGEYIKYDSHVEILKVLSEKLWEAKKLLLDSCASLAQVKSDIDSLKTVFATAQEMLDALKSVEESIICFMVVHHYPPDSGAGEVLRQVQQAIAKASQVTYTPIAEDSDVDRR